MRAKWIVGVLILAGGLVFLAKAGAPQAPQLPEVTHVLKTMQGGNGLTAPRVSYTPEGYIKFLGAPAGASFSPSPSAKSQTTPEAVAKGFLSENAKAFGILDSNVGFVSRRTVTGHGFTYLHLTQQFKGVPIIGGEVMVQLNVQNNVLCVESDIMRQASNLYTGALPTTPSVDAARAKQTALSTLGAEHPLLQFQATTPTLKIYSPVVLKNVGPVRLVWDISVSSSSKGISERVFVDAIGGGVVHRYSLIESIKNRLIYDADETDSPVLVRVEGGPPTGVADADLAYDYFGDTYDFYNTFNNRDSLNNAGLTLVGIVRFCPDPFDCPMQNAFWSSIAQAMFFGQGFVTDDVVGHELTHGVTSFTSDLDYENESGALNESLSDMWGEWIDLTDGQGNDYDDVRWLMGEEVPGGAIRDMKDPTRFSNPAIYAGPFWFFGTGDNGGVHENSGVSNKFCYLITDGDFFNGFNVTGLGIATATELVYEIQTNLLGSSSDFAAFGNLAIQAAMNLGFTSDQLNTVRSALYATRILLPEQDFKSFRAQGSSQDTGKVALTWFNPGISPFTGYTIVRRSDGRFPANASDGTFVADITNGDESFVDAGGFANGANEFYGLFPDGGTDPAIAPEFARAVAGEDTDFLSEAFTQGTDLSFEQITFVPIGSLEDANNSGAPTAYFNHKAYAATIHPINGLPVSHENVWDLPMTDEAGVQLSLPVPIPFFGEFVNTLILSANGNLITSADAYELAYLPTFPPTLDTHFLTQRISFLFADLDPASGGDVWARYLDDRLAITFENVPTFDAFSFVPGQDYTNTVQCELFYSGEIRFTYGIVTARQAVVGLSDGRLVPPNPHDVISGASFVRALNSDLTALGSTLPIQINPIPVQFALAGDPVNFTAVATSTAGTPTYGLLFNPTGSSINSTTGAFTWNTANFRGTATYSFAVTAQAGGKTATQVVNVVLSEDTILPTAENLSITPGTPHDSDNLVASYTYCHQFCPPDVPGLAEGPSTIFWFRDNSLIPAFTNQKFVPAAATKVGQQWYFMVTPTTLPIGFAITGPIYLRGTPVQSPIVTIGSDAKVDTNGDGKINSLDLQIVISGVLGTTDAKSDPDVNHDGSVDASDLQMVVNGILFAP